MGQKGPNHFISGEQFQKRPNLADFTFKKSKWQPCHEPQPAQTHTLTNIWHLFLTETVQLQWTLSLCGHSDRNSV